MSVCVCVCVGGGGVKYYATVYMYQCLGNVRFTVYI